MELAKKKKQVMGEGKGRVGRSLFVIHLVIVLLFCIYNGLLC